MSLYAFRMFGYVGMIIVLIMLCAPIQNLVMGPSQEELNAMWVEAHTTLVVSESHVNDAIATKTINEGQATLLLAEAEFSMSPAGGVKIYNQGQAAAGKSLLIMVSILAAALFIGFSLYGPRR